MKKYPSQEQLKQLLSYNPETGIFTWKRRSVTKPQDKTWNKRFPGTIAGNVNDSGKGKNYIDIALNALGMGKFRAHRLAWIYIHGTISRDLEIDHIDGNGTNNALSNLRLVESQLNMKNQRLRSTNSTGVSGVSMNSRTGKFEAYITVNNKRHHLGRYANLELAVKARKHAEVKYNFHENHGSKRPL